MKKFALCLLRVAKVVLDAAESLSRARRVARDLGFGNNGYPRSYINSNNRPWPQQ